MELSYVGSYEELSREAVRIIVDQVRAKPSLLLCPATGDTPTLTYSLLAEYAKANKNLFSQMRLAGLDEWGGLESDDPGSCHSYLKKFVIDPLEITAARSILFEGNAPNLDHECSRIEGLLNQSGPIDLCVLGLGINGHLGFNEPGSSLTAGCHVARLSASSQNHPMTKGMKLAPSFGLTLGMAGILRARKILLLISGRHKREVTRKLISSSITTQFPASFLTLHPQVSCIIDKEAAGKP